MIFAVLLLSSDNDDVEAIIVLVVGVIWVVIAFTVTIALSAVRIRTTRNGRRRVLSSNAVLLPYEQTT